MDRVRLPVIFRAEKSDGETVAVFPTLPANAGMVVVYAHLGQHGEGSRAWIRLKTRPAKPEEYTALLHELRGIYENGPDAVTLRVMKRLA